ncbi:PKD domain-containing protein [Methanolobus sp. WCC4]|uniref:PKD domain-containing protein n=1 Tax=Methanolobus sp. WCC4 TaxID=3125784 RepID=UPI0030F6AA15
MKINGMRIFACLVVLLMLMSIFPTGALADSDNSKNYGEKTIRGNNGNDNVADSDQDDDSDDGEDSDESSDDEDDSTTDQVRDRDRIMLNATEDANRKRSESRNSESDYQTAKIKFADIRSKNPKLDTEEAINATKEYLIDTIDYMISLLDEDNEYIDALEEERDNVEKATTREELADSAKNIRDIWNDARKNRVTASSKAIDNKINAVLKTSEKLVVRLENEITTMKENGEDVEDLEEMLEEYKDLIDDAKENQVNARNTYGNGNNGQNIREANRYIVKAGEDIKDANAILRKMLQELKKEREGVVVLTGTGTLAAEGNGTAVISGNVSIEIEANEYAKLVIKDLAGDADINLSKANYETSNIDSGNSTDNNRAFVFINLTEEVFIEGSRLTVMVKGSDIELTVNGTGTAVLAGIGTYEVNGEEGEWASRYVDDDDSSDDEEEEEEEVDDNDESEEEVDDDDDEDSENEEDSVTVVANFTYTIDGLNVTFTDTSMNASSWNWDFDDGNYSTEQSPTHEYALYKEYNVTLTAYESDSDELNNDSITQSIKLTV